MSFKRFVKYFLLALGFQLALLLVVSPLVSRLFPGGKALPDFLEFYVYQPFISAIISGGGYTGESSMIWPPVFGILLGVCFYSILLGLAALFLNRERA
jgi:hypothetical protein